MSYEQLLHHYVLEPSGVRFSDLVDEFGKEFSHGGSIDSASAYVSHRLENGVTLAIVSDTEGFGLASELAQTIRENLLKPKPVE